MAMTNVNVIKRREQALSMRAQRDRDVKLRREREERAYAHEAGLQAKAETGKDRRTQAAGEFGLAQQRLVGESALRTGTQRIGATGTQAALNRQQDISQQQTGIKAAAETARVAHQYGQANIEQRAGVAKDTAEQLNKYQGEAFSRNLGAQAYLGGQDPSAANQLTAAGQFPPDYSGLKPFGTPQPKSYKRIDPVYSKDIVPKLIEPGGTFEESTGTMDYDANKRSAQALIKKLQAEERRRKQALGY